METKMLSMEQKVHCDNDNCDYVSEICNTVEQLESYVNKECPNCKSNLMTDDSYLNAIAIDVAYSMALKLPNQKERQRFASAFDVIIKAIDVQSNIGGKCRIEFTTQEKIGITSAKKEK